MIKITAKIVRKEGCPINLEIPCIECEHYDGWGFDVERFNKGDNLKNISVFDIWCKEPGINNIKSTETIKV